MVAEGLPLTEALASRFGVRPGTVQRVRALPPGCCSPDGLASVLKRVDRLPPHAVPTTEVDWAVVRRLHDPLEALAQTIGVDFARFLKPFATGWQAGLAAIEAKLQGALDVDAIYEMMHCAYRYGVRPALLEALPAARSPAAVAVDPPAGFFPFWFGRYGLVRLAEMAAEWREASGQLCLARLSLGGRLGEGQALQWPGLLASGAARGDRRVVELTSYQALELEGRRLEHCVASYAIKCLMAGSSIFSIRDGTGRALSTFEVQMPAAGAPRLLQHKARGNATPSAELQALAQRFVEQVLGPLPREQIAAVHRVRRAIGTRVRGFLGSPNTPAPDLRPEESRRLAATIAFAHPAETKQLGIVPFLLQHGREVLDGMRGPRQA